MTEIRIYVASLADYNAGRLHGRWIDATLDVDDIWAEINEMLAESKEAIAEEHAIHDYEGFGDLRLSEYESISHVHEIAMAIEEHGDAIIAYLGNDFDADLADFEEAYYGHFSSEEDFAESLADDIGAVDRNAVWPDNCIDWERAARDLFYGGDFWSAKGSAPEYGIHVFRNY